MAQRTLISAALACSMVACLLIAPGQAQSRPPDPTNPCVLFNNTGYLTATNKCPHDTFQVSMVSGEYAKGADATPAPAKAQFHWLGPFIEIKSGGELARPLEIAVLRNTDGKFVVPKGVNADGSLRDLTSSKRQVCQLFFKGKPDFAIFRAKLGGGGTRVVGNDFYIGRRPAPGPPGVPCAEYYEEPEGDPKKGRNPVEGRMVDMYSLKTCHFVIDDCSK